DGRVGGGKNFVVVEQGDVHPRIVFHDLLQRNSHVHRGGCAGTPIRIPRQFPAVVLVGELRRFVRAYVGKIRGYRRDQNHLVGTDKPEVRRALLQKDWLRT